MRRASQTCAFITKFVFQSLLYNLKLVQLNQPDDELNYLGVCAISATCLRMHILIHINVFSVLSFIRRVDRLASVNAIRRIARHERASPGI